MDHVPKKPYPIDRPSAPRTLIEIKSTPHLSERTVKTLERFQPDFPRSESFCLSLDPHPKIIGRVNCLPWEQGLKELGL